MADAADYIVKQRPDEQFKQREYVRRRDKVKRPRKRRNSERPRANQIRATMHQRQRSRITVPEKNFVELDLDQDSEVWFFSLIYESALVDFLTIF